MIVGSRCAPSSSASSTAAYSTLVLTGIQECLKAAIGDPPYNGNAHGRQASHACKALISRAQTELSDALTHVCRPHAEQPAR